VNNYIVGNNNTIVNNGISRDYVASHARTEIPKVSVREESRAQGRVIPPDRVQKAGNELVVYRPTSPPAQAETALRQTQERIRPSSAGPRVATGTPVLASRPNGSDARGTADAHRATSGGSVASRGEVARPQLSARTETPIYGTPQPLRPEPLPRTVFRPSTTTAGNLRPSISSSPSVNSGLVATSPTGRPETLAANTDQRTEPQSLRPSFNPQARNEVSRSPGITPNMSQPITGNPAAQPNQQTPIRRESINQNQQLAARAPIPSRNPEQVSPRGELNNSSAESVSPAFPSGNSGARPNANVSNVPRFGPQGGGTPAPQVIRPSSPYSQSMPPNTVLPPNNTFGRTEGYGGSRAIPSSPIQRTPVQAPAPVVLPPPQAPVRSESPRIESPRGSVNVAPAAPAGGAAVRSAPPAQAQRPNAVQPNASGGRGRV
jgi:hypothetical protein